MHSDSTFSAETDVDIAGVAAEHLNELQRSCAIEFIRADLLILDHQNVGIRQPLFDIRRVITVNDVDATRNAAFLGPGSKECLGVCALGQKKLGLQENEWVFSATSERWEHACEHLEPQIFLVA